MTLLEPNRDQLEIFVDALFRHAGQDGWVSMRAFYEDDKNAVMRTTPASLTGGLRFIVDVAEDDARRAANAPRAAVFCPPLAVFNNKQHAREADLLIGPALTVECDQHPQDARTKLEQILGLATLVVRSGGQWTDPQTGEIQDKIHLHWRLKQAAKGKDNLAKLKQARVLAAHLVGGDTSNVPICHPIRWPGSWHRKSAPRLCEIIEQHPDNEIDLDEALTKLNGGTPPPPGGGGQQQQAGGGQQQQQGGYETLAWNNAFGAIITGKQFHPILTPLSASFAALGVPETATRRALRALLNNTQTTDAARLKRRDAELGKLRNTVHSGYEKFAAAVPADTLLDPWAEIKMPDFPLDTLPTIVRRFVEDQSIVSGFCPNAMTLAVLCALSGAIDHRFKLKMMRHGTWWERPRLWGLLVGDPSKKKTPIINAATQPLERRQRELVRDYKALLRAHLRAGGKADDNDAPEKPPFHVVYDPTIEALGEILERSPRGLLVKRDELPGWIGGMEKYAGSARGSDRGFWLQAFDGKNYSVHRIKRGDIFIPNLSISLIGGIQPAKLVELQGLTSDGLLQRFLVTIITTADRGCDVESNERPYTELIYKLLATPAQRFTLTDDALMHISALLDHLHKLEQMSGGAEMDSNPLSAS